MFTINGKSYLELDQFLSLETLPSVEEAISESYQLIWKNSWQKTTTLSGETSNCTWLNKGTTLESEKDIFAMEVKNRTVSPMWILNLTEGGEDYTENLYDSLGTAKQEWEKIRFRLDLHETWSPFVNWLQELTIFEKLGRTSLIIARPGVPTNYHRDIGVLDEEFCGYPHRQEFLWLNVTPEKEFFILDADRQPILVEAKAAFFNHHSWHGSHKSFNQWGFSFKIEGIFSQEFRARIGLSEVESYL